MPVPVVQQLKVGKAILVKRRGCETGRGKAAQDVVPLAVQTLGMDLITLVSSISLRGLSGVGHSNLRRAGEGVRYLYMPLLALLTALAGLGVRPTLSVHQGRVLDTRERG